MLFIAVDDLRPELGIYDMEQMVTANFDRLAAKSVTFERAYCQQAVCAPSRNSILTGLRPDALGIYDLSTFFRKKVPEVVTLPQHFKRQGYHTERMGKLYHTGHGNQDDTLSWSKFDFAHSTLLRALPKITRGDTLGLESDFPTLYGKKLPFYCSPEPEAHMTDAMTADHAVERIGKLKDSTFFLAVGFVKPHLPFVAPKKYWDLYDPAAIQIPDTSLPKNMASMALASFGELRKYDNIPAKGPLDEATTRKMIHGYYASVSMIDAQLGKLLDALKENGVEENTIIVLWGDHGYKLGEYASWCKHSNMELDTRVPLFISSPSHAKALKTQSITELVDLYPTLCDLAGVPKPEHLEGQSLVQRLDNPTRNEEDVAISQYPRGPSLGYDRKNQWMGYSIRTERYRYTRWQHYEDPAEVVARELYDHSSSPIATENLASDQECQAQIEALDQQLDAELAKYHLWKP
ncbi:MAG: sulfatase [Saprospiraceae bacterium]|nr:sulfatase [Saprospiraceae bacterium]